MQVSNPLHPLNSSNVLFEASEDDSLQVSIFGPIREKVYETPEIYYTREELENLSNVSLSAYSTMSSEKKDQVLREASQPLKKIIEKFNSHMNRLINYNYEANYVNPSRALIETHLMEHLDDPNDELSPKQEKLASFLEKVAEHHNIESAKDVPIAMNRMKALAKIVNDNSLPEYRTALFSKVRKFLVGENDTTYQRIVKLLVQKFFENSSWSQSISKLNDEFSYAHERELLISSEREILIRTKGLSPNFKLSWSDAKKNFLERWEKANAPTDKVSLLNSSSSSNDAPFVLKTTGTREELIQRILNPQVTDFLSIPKGRNPVRPMKDYKKKVSMVNYRNYYEDPVYNVSKIQDKFSKHNPGIFFNSVMTYSLASILYTKENRTVIAAQYNQGEALNVMRILNLSQTFDPSQKLQSDFFDYVKPAIRRIYLERFSNKKSLDILIGKTLTYNTKHTYLKSLVEDVLTVLAKEHAGSFVSSEEQNRRKLWEINSLFEFLSVELFQHGRHYAGLSVVEIQLIMTKTSTIPDMQLQMNQRFTQENSGRACWERYEKGQLANLVVHDYLTGERVWYHQDLIYWIWRNAVILKFLAEKGVNPSTYAQIKLVADDETFDVNEHAARLNVIFPKGPITYMPYRNYRADPQAIISSIGETYDIGKLFKRIEDPVVAHEQWVEHVVRKILKVRRGQPKKVAAYQQKTPYSELLRKADELKLKPFAIVKYVPDQLSAIAEEPIISESDEKNTYTFGEDSIFSLEHATSFFWNKKKFPNIAKFVQWYRFRIPYAIKNRLVNMEKSKKEMINGVEEIVKESVYDFVLNASDDDIKSGIQTLATNCIKHAARFATHAKVRNVINHHFLYATTFEDLAKTRVSNAKSYWDVILNTSVDELIDIKRSLGDEKFSENSLDLTIYPNFTNEYVNSWLVEKGRYYGHIMGLVFNLISSFNAMFSSIIDLDTNVFHIPSKTVIVCNRMLFLNYVNSELLTIPTEFDLGVRQAFNEVLHEKIYQSGHTDINNNSRILTFKDDEMRYLIENAWYFASVSAIFTGVVFKPSIASKITTLPLDRKTFNDAVLYLISIFGVLMGGDGDASIREKIICVLQMIVHPTLWETSIRKLLPSMYEVEIDPDLDVENFRKFEPYLDDEDIAYLYSHMDLVYEKIQQSSDKDSSISRHAYRYTVAQIHTYANRLNRNSTIILDTLKRRENLTEIQLEANSARSLKELNLDRNRELLRQAGAETYAIENGEL